MACCQTFYKLLCIQYVAHASNTSNKFNSLQHNYNEILNIELITMFGLYKHCCNKAYINGQYHSGLVEYAHAWITYKMMNFYRIYSMPGNLSLLPSSQLFTSQLHIVGLSRLSLRCVDERKMMHPEATTTSLVEQVVL